MDHKAGMFAYALAFLLGVLLLQQLPLLPDYRQLILLLLAPASLYYLLHRYVFSAVIYKKCPCLRIYTTLISVYILLIIIGFIYAFFYASQHLSYRLDERFVGADIIVTGHIDGIPVSTEKIQRLQFKVKTFRVLNQQSKSLNAQANILAKRFPEKLRLNWYYGKAVKADEKWQLQVRLKPPHGFMNPGGFDYEGWLFQQGIHATGYVRQSALNKRLQTASAYSIDHIRESLSDLINTAANARQKTNDLKHDNTMALVKALAIGDKSSLSSQQWQVLTDTGTSHLMAISGLHIGLAALFAYVLIRRMLPAFIMQRFPAQHIALAGGMLMALFYALIAGLSIPTQRAVIMLIVLSIMMLIRRNSRPVDSLGLALLIVLLIDPSAVLSAGFWFSFAAVAVIYLSLLSGGKNQSVRKLPLAWLAYTLKQWLRLQLIISIFLLPLSLFMFQQVSLVSPLANLLLIPYVSFLVVPVVLMAIVGSFVSSAIAPLLFNLAASLLDLIWPLLRLLSEQPYALWVQGDVNVAQLLMATSAIVLIFFSATVSKNILQQLPVCHSESKVKGFSWLLRVAGTALFVPLLIADGQEISQGDYRMTVLDVGQGSAAVIQTQNHVAVFDSGARFSDKMDAGSSVVIPFLRSRSVSSLDRLIISHGDADHIGGARAIITEYPEAELIGQDIDSLLISDSTVTGSGCFAGNRWRWDGVLFEFLSPGENDSVLLNREKRNNRSCVLHISSAAGSVLLTGDIEKQVEKQLLERHGSRLSADILIVPHHGSNTSSNPLFISAVEPEISIFTVGYNNRYKLPGRAVWKRYQASGSRLLRTDSSGAITISMQAGEGMLVERYREQAGRYWHHKLN